MNINDIVNQYMLLGVLQDSEGNLIEYNDCIAVTALGIQNFTFDFNGLRLYKNQVDGPYDLIYIEMNKIANCSAGGGMPPELEDSLIDAHNPQQ